MFARFRAMRLQFGLNQKKQEELTMETCKLTRQQIETGYKALRILGLEKKEQLSKHDLVIFLYAVGLNPTDDVIDSKLRILKLHQNEKVTFPELCHIWHSMLQDLTDEEEILRRAFQFFDKDGNGEISVTELRTTMHELGDLLTEEEIMNFMQVMDVNNDGVIGYQEFLATLKTQTGADAGDPFFENNAKVNGMQNSLGPKQQAVAEGRTSNTRHNLTHMPPGVIHGPQAESPVLRDESDSEEPGHL